MSTLINQIKSNKNTLNLKWIRSISIELQVVHVDGKLETVLVADQKAAHKHRAREVCGNNQLVVAQREDVARRRRREQKEARDCGVDVHARNALNNNASVGFVDRFARLEAHLEHFRLDRVVELQHKLPNLGTSLQFELATSTNNCKSTNLIII